jgi:hypothetical protein
MTMRWKRARISTTIPVRGTMGMTGKMHLLTNTRMMTARIVGVPEGSTKVVPKI